MPMDYITSENILLIGSILLIIKEENTDKE